MRLKINFTVEDGTKMTVNNQSLLNSYFHNCLGRNNKYHDSKDDCCVSDLRGGLLNKEEQTLTFPNNKAYFTVSSLDSELINKIILGVLSNPNFGHGLTFTGIDPISEKFYNGWNHFFTLSPLLIKKERSIKGIKRSKSENFLTILDPDFELKVKQYLIHKLSTIDNKLDLKNFNVKIGNNLKNKKTEKMIKNIVNVATYCQISIFTNKKVAELLYNIGLGQSTSCGFGTIYKTENKNLYVL